MKIFAKEEFLTLANANTYTPKFMWTIIKTMFKRTSIENHQIFTHAKHMRIFNEWSKVLREINFYTLLIV